MSDGEPSISQIGRSPVPLIAPRAAGINVTLDAPIAVLPLAERQRLVRRRRRLLGVRDLMSVVGIGFFGLLLILVAILSFLAR